jgi:hypothetical protein
MDNETYNVIFCSRNSNVVGGVANLNGVVYNVNWDSILPRDKYKRFVCNFVFKSENYVGNLTNNGYVNVNFGKVNCYDGVSNVGNIGIIYPVSLVANSSFYNSTNNDNNAFYCNYPASNLVTITLNNLAGGVMANMPHYVLIINFQGVE